MSHANCCWPLAALTLLPLMGAARAQTPAQIGRDPMGVLYKLKTATDPKTVALRRRIEAGPADLARALAAIKKDGVPLDPVSLQRPLPPPDLNAAPLYTMLFRLLRDKPVNLPIYAQPLTGDHTYTPAQIAAVQKVYDSRPDVWGLLHQATDRPQCVWTRDWSRGYAALFPEFQQMREAARLINTETFLLVAQGKHVEAVKNQARGLRVAEHAASDPVLISYLVGNACEAITLRGMQNLLDQAGPDAAVAEAVRQAVQTDRPRLSLRYALTGEVATQAVAFRQMHEGLNKSGLPAVAALLVNANDPILKRLTPGTPADRRLAGDWLDASEAIILTRMDSLLAAADLTPAPRRQAFARDAAAQAAGPPSVLTLLPDMLLPVFAKVEGNETRRVAQEEVTLAAAALVAARAKAGAFPDALPASFVDPYTSRPLLYRREGAGGFVVYSAGPDGDYNGGKPGERVLPVQAGFRYPVTKTPAP